MMKKRLPKSDSDARAEQIVETTGLTQVDGRSFNLKRFELIRDEADYDRMVLLMNELIDTVGDDETHPLAGLLDLVGELVSDFDGQQYAIPSGESQQVLAYLMKTRGMKQTDLADLVAQPNLSAILNGRRAIPRELAKGLAQRFNVGVDVFL